MSAAGDAGKRVTTKNASQQREESLGSVSIRTDQTLAKVFHEHANTGRRPQNIGFNPGLARDDGDGPPRRNAQFAFPYRSNMTRDRRSARPDSCYPAVELRDAETPDFLLVGRFEREHCSPLLRLRLSPLNLSCV
jgi:hypothetical protein